MWITDVLDAWLKAIDRTARKLWIGRRRGHATHDDVEYDEDDDKLS